MFPGGATVPGRALMDTLPLVSQMVMEFVLWQVGRASATGAATRPRATIPATTSAELPGTFIGPAFRLLEAILSGSLRCRIRTRSRRSNRKNLGGGANACVIFFSRLPGRGEMRSRQ